MVRFTDAELLKITALAAELIEAGLWRKMERVTTPEHDRIMILMERGSCSYYKIERDQTGWTYLAWCAPDTWDLLASGTLDECLEVFA